MLIGAGDVDSLDWSKQQALLPAVVQDAADGKVLMLGYMNREALQETFRRGRVVFYSRSRATLWEKGETSGNHLALERVYTDCDRDTVLVTARPAGPVCHTGTLTCFGDDVAPGNPALRFLAALEAIIEQRLRDKPAGSYTAKLQAAGIRRIAQKVGEEGLEVALAGAGEADAQVVSESADLIFHLLVLLRSRGLALGEVVAELERRHATPRT